MLTESHVWDRRQRGRVYARKEGRRQDKESMREGRKINGFEVIQLTTTPYSPFCINSKQLMCYIDLFYIVVMEVPGQDILISSLPVCFIFRLLCSCCSVDFDCWTFLCVSV